MQRCGDVEGAWRGLGNDGMEVKSRSRKRKGNLVSGNGEVCAIMKLTLNLTEQTKGPTESVMMASKLHYLCFRKMCL